MNSDLAARVQRRLDSLTKPPSSLGMLEEIALRYCVARDEYLPGLPRKGMFLFCADHGVTEESVSAYPSAVTAQMVANFEQGGAAINVLCRHFNIETRIIDCGVGVPTANFARMAAMSREKADHLLKRGRMLARDAAHQFDLVGLGEMGIGNTTSAAALLSVFGGHDPKETVGRGTGLDDRGVAHKAEVIRRALELHQPDAKDAVGVLAAIGGFEIGTMAGFLIGAAEARLPVVIDGFISSAAALIAKALNPNVLDTAFFSHRSAERGHALMLETLNVKPALDLGLRLGEGSGAALMMNLIESSLRIYTEMATFDEAGVSNVK